MNEFSIVRLNGIHHDLFHLVEQSLAEGHRHIQKLVQEYQSGTNRFNHEGETLLAAVYKGRIVGICGLNRNPFENSNNIGRVRRLYVLKEYRRNGFGEKLMEGIMDVASLHYKVLVLYTDNPAADKFYKALGFTESSSFEKSTHYLELNSLRGY
ncbi:GNAT family N-acetyltransferase [Paenibacillus sp. GCM10027628]|uniref:GNAT family N-acetyltransferase n=1 Tax=Paenibacillus sp. GCM10027628 TaxID=3273413 RepID=UPI003630CD0F